MLEDKVVRELPDMAYDHWCENNQDIRKTASFVGVSKDMIKRWKRIYCWDERRRFQSETATEVLYRKWDTDDEKMFIDTLGEHSPQKELTAGRRLWLLIKYREALRNREEWGYVDRDKVMKHLERRITEFAR